MTVRRKHIPCFLDVELDLEDPSLFEGDIVLTDEQRAAVEGARGSITQKLWPGGVVVYELDPRFERSSRAMEKLTQAISDYEKYTCIRFRKKTANDNDYVYINDRGGFFCDFDHGTCGFVQSSSDNFNWIRNTGSTSTQNTGPSSDTSGIGHYMYIETSKGRQGYTARLEKRGVSE
ncbi:predicted protein, partial [Nematostella vectensis]